MKQALRQLIPIFLILSLMFGCTNSSDNNSVGNNIKRLSWSFAKSEFEMQLGETKSGYILADVSDRDDFKPENIVFVSEDESVATISYSRATLSVYLYFDITAVSAGKTSVYAVSADGETISDKLILTVTDDKASSEYDTMQTEFPQTEAPQTENSQTTVSDINPPKTNFPETDPTSTSVSKETATPPHVSVAPITPSEDDQYIYVLNTSTKKIHKMSCSSVKRIKPENYAITADYADAIAQGYVQCKNCD